MSYQAYRMGGGINGKTDPAAQANDTLVTARNCSFDVEGRISSARGRTKLNGGTPIAGSGSILGHFDGEVSGTKVRYTKRGGTTYENFTALLPAPASLWPGRDAIAASSTDYLTGFTYNNKTYLADGQSCFRYVGGEAQTWGLNSPGYQELTVTPLSTTSGLTTVTVTTPENIDTGMSGTQNIELVGLDGLGGVVSEDINKLHFNSSGFTDADVKCEFGPMNTAAVRITFQRLLAATSITQIEVDREKLEGPEQWEWTRIVPGSASPPTNEVQEISFSGATGGTFRLKHEGEWTQDIAYNATAAQVQDALIALPNISASTSNASIVATITGAKTFTIEASANATASVTGGGTIGFMRQGPLLTIETSGGGLEGGRYFYAYTFYNGVAESNFSAQVPVEVVTRGSKVTVGQILPGPAGTTERRIYRTDVNQRQLYYIGKIEDNTTTSFVDVAKLPPGGDPWTNYGDIVIDKEFEDSVLSKLSPRKRAERRALLDKLQSERDRQRRATNLGLLAEWTDHDPPPADIQEIGILNETGFGVSGNEIRFSEIGQIEHWPLGNRIKPGRNTSETVQTWRAFDRDCIIYTQSGLYRLSMFGSSFSDSRYDEIDSPVGLAGKRAVAALDGMAGHVFLAKSGIYLFDGQRVNEISYAVEHLFTDSTHTDYVNPAFMGTAVMAASRDRVFLSYGSAAANDRLMLIDFQNVQNPRFSVYDWRHTMLFRERSDNALVAGTADGVMYQLDSGESDAGSGIYWLIQTKPFRLSDGLAVRLDELILDADFAGASTVLNVYVRQRDITQTSQHTLATTGRQRHKVKLPTKMKGEEVYVTLASTSAFQRSLGEIGFTYLPMGEP